MSAPCHQRTEIYPLLEILCPSAYRMTDKFTKSGVQRSFTEAVDVEIHTFYVNFDTKRLETQKQKYLWTWRYRWAKAVQYPI
jgi:hypothetical protein